MLFDDYAAVGRLVNSNFTGHASKSPLTVYRGDWALEGDFDLPPNDRRPPTVLLAQAVAVASEQSVEFLAGALMEVADLQKLLALDGERLSGSFLGVIYARDIGKPISVVLSGAQFQIFPYDDTLVYNELLDLLYLEKSDLKGLSAEDKVIKVFESAKSFSFKTSETTWKDLLASRIEAKKLDRVGAV